MHTISLAAPLLALLAWSVPALAADEHCKHAEPRQLTLDPGDARAVVFEVGPHDLEVESRAGAPAAISGKACSSHADRLAHLKVEQRRAGDKLIVRMYEEGTFGGIFFGNRYAYLDLVATLPDHLSIQVKVGSGDVEVSGAPVFSADVGSGDVVGRNIRGLAAVSVGSGDVTIQNAGSLKVVSIGSGDVEAHNVRGSTTVGSIGSGDFSLSGSGHVEIGSIGSGDAEVRDITGNVVVGSIGSGGVEARNIGGGLTVRSVGSGDVRHEGVRGPLDIPKHD